MRMVTRQPRASMRARARRAVILALPTVRASVSWDVATFRPVCRLAVAASATTKAMNVSTLIEIRRLWASPAGVARTAAVAVTHACWDVGERTPA